MAKRKIKKKDILKCRGLHVAPCFHCRRQDDNAPESLIQKMNTGRNGLNTCEHYYSTMQ